MKVKFTLEIHCDNDAFARGGVVVELKRLIKMTGWMVGQYVPHRIRLAKNLETPLFDANGNCVGNWKLIVDDLNKPEVTSEDDPPRHATDPDIAPGTSFLGDPPQRRKRGMPKSRYLDPDAPLDTPSLDTSFHDGEMDVE